MSEEFTLSLPIAAVEELHCSMCQSYLSCSPVRLLSNGNYICGRCSPLNVDEPIHRLLALEIFLEKMSFPCIFKKLGCLKTILFGETANHESKCVHKPFPCPSNIFGNCLWEGSTAQFLHHFQGSHATILKDTAEFNLEVDQNVQNVLMITKYLGSFVVKYVYNANEGILKYDVRLCKGKIGCGVSFRMLLTNSSDAEYNILLKNNECCVYDETFYGMQNANVLNINKLLECLGDPDCLVIVLKLKLV